MTSIPTHGGNLRLASERYGRKEWLDFSANINPLGVPMPLQEALVRAVADGTLEHYPDPDSSALRDAFAQKHGLAPDQVLVTNGASEALNGALAVLPHGSVAIPVPSFGEYTAVAVLHGHAPLLIPMSGDQFGVPCPKKRYRGVILGNPNNPTSRLLNQEILLAWLDSCDWAIVDEAFLELTAGGEQNSSAKWLERYPNLIVLRALTKLLAIPGLRLGYALAGEQWIQRMKERQATWSVNALAQVAADVLPGLDGYLSETMSWISSEPQWLYEQLNALPGLEVWKPDTNFILCRCARSAGEVVAKMTERGILLRDASNFMGLDNRYFRTAVRTRQENQRLIGSLREVLV
jgi:threonine-phosphate decarboxylase